MNEDKLVDEVENLTDYILEQYSQELKKVRKLGDLILKTYAKTEDLMDQIIMSWNAGYGSRPAFAQKLFFIRKYMPLLANMMFLGKIKAIIEYQVVNKNDKLVAQLRWLNDERNMFAHYNVFHHKLEKKYETTSSRVKTLKKLKEIILSTEIVSKAVIFANDKRLLSDLLGKEDTKAK